jgi:hypothetical protein
MYELITFSSEDVMSGHVWQLVTSQVTESNLVVLVVQAAVFNYFLEAVD